jgi:hypothetical protein
MSTSERIVERSLETLITGFGVFFLLVMIDRMSNTTYFRDSFWALFAISVAVVAPILSAIYHFLRWAGNRQPRSSAPVKSEA